MNWCPPRLRSLLRFFFALLRQVTFAILSNQHHIVLDSGLAAVMLEPGL